ncbi:MAG: carboxypeptidase-like regulatory domain-containing protein [Flavobacteriaceae bacterium]
MKNKLIFLIIFLPFAMLSQEVETIKKDTLHTLRGVIIDVKSRVPLKSAHVFNLNTVSGMVTNKSGKFSIIAKKNDTIHVSFIGYESVKLRVTNDLLKTDDLKIAIDEKAIEMDEIVVKSHHLVGVLAIDAKSVPEVRPKQIHIEGLAQTFEIGKPRSRNYESPLAAVFNPIDFWYAKLGKKPKEMKKLKKLREEDDLKDIMKQKFDRELMLEYLDLSRDELNELLKDCNHSKKFIKKASDLQIVNAVINCIEGHKTVKIGKVKKEIIHLSEEEPPTTPTKDTQPENE